MAKKKPTARRKTPAKSEPVVPMRVVIEITASGYSTKVFADNEGCGTERFLSNREMVMQDHGGAKGRGPGDVSDDLADFSDLSDELQMTNSFQIAKCLRDIAGL